jgi:signal transduction histidine kinase
VPLAPLFDSVAAENVEFAQQKGIELRIRPTRAVVVSNAVILDGVVRNLVRNAIVASLGSNSAVRQSTPSVERWSRRCERRLPQHLPIRRFACRARELHR